MAIWFTADINKAMTQRPVDDLKHNEITIREFLDYQVETSLYATEDISKDPLRWAEYKKISKEYT